MITEELKDKKIAILGAGVEGLATAEYLELHGLKPVLLDEKDDKNAFSKLDKYEIVFRSPGVSSRREELIKAKDKGVSITSQTQFFLENCPCPVVGVTGTKGKGTTSSLLYEMLKASGKDVYLGGNIGTPALSFLDKLTKGSLVVLELSSFQLEDVTLSPHIAIMLMITPEHLEHHGSLENYIAAKRNLLAFQTDKDFAIINRDYPASNESDIHTQAKVFYVSSERETAEGCYALGNTIYLNRNGQTEELLKTDDVSLPGRHNLENVCAAIMAAVILEIQRKYIFQVVKTFKGLPHRLELVHEVNGVKYYDDSIATNPESAIAGIMAFKEPKVLILGGVTEGSDFTELGEHISNDPTIKAIIGIGKEWPQIKARIKNQEARIMLVEGAKNMSQIVQAAYKIAKPGDIVLLSPACKSFDMFASYKDRGDQFKAEVNKL